MSMTQIDDVANALQHANIEYDFYNLNKLHNELLKRSRGSVDQLALDENKYIITLPNKITFWFDIAGNLVDLKPEAPFIK